MLKSHEEVQTVVIIKLETGKTTIPGVECMVYGVKCMVVPHSFENKALGLSLAIVTDLVATRLLPIDRLMASDCNITTCAKKHF